MHHVFRELMEATVSSQKSTVSSQKLSVSSQWQMAVSELWEGVSSQTDNPSVSSLKLP